MIGSVSSPSFSAFSAFRYMRDRSSSEAADQARPPSDPKSPPADTEEKSHATNAFKVVTTRRDQDPKQARELTEAEKEQVEKLKQRDAEVRNHEMAHLAAAGSLAQGGPTYSYQVGPDGRSYAVGGDVKIDTSPGRTPEETIRKAAQIRAAALAPADPSPQDVKVAAAAGSLAANAAQKAQKAKNQALSQEGPDEAEPSAFSSSSIKQIGSSPAETEPREQSRPDDAEIASDRRPLYRQAAKAYERHQIHHVAPRE